MAPVLVLDPASGPKPQLIGAVTLVANGSRMIGVTSAELLRPLLGKQLAIATKLDGSSLVKVSAWTMGRYSGIGLVELAEPFPSGHDVTPLSIGSVNASVDVHGAPAAIVTVAASGSGYERGFLAVHVDPDDGGGMSDHTIHLASPLDPLATQTPIEGAPVFAWLPPDPVLGRPSEVVVFALAYPYRAQIAKPRDTPVIAELVGLDDLGKALIVLAPEPDARPELGTVTGEIVDPAADPLAGLDE